MVSRVRIRVLLLLKLLIQLLLAATPPVQDAGPGVRAHHCLVYDASREAVVMAGGSTAVNDDDSRLYDELWSFDGAAWQRIGALGQPLAGLRLACEPGRGLVAFGGFTDDRRTLGDLRAWVDGEWRLIDAAADKASVESGFVFDSRRGCFVLFGGAAAGQNRGTTWEWNGTAWVTRDVPGPAPRSAHGLVYDERRGKVVLFGGSGPGRLGDTWEWDGERWTRSEEPGPPARVAPGLAYDSKRGRTLLFGGGGADGALGDTWVFDGTTWQQLDIAGPPPRLTPGLAYDVKRDLVVLFGGRRGWPHDLGDTWVFDGASWKEIVAP